MSRLHCFDMKGNASCFQLHNGFCMNMARCYRRDEYSGRDGVKIKADAPRGKHGGFRPKKAPHA